MKTPLKFCLCMVLMGTPLAYAEGKRTRAEVEFAPYLAMASSLDCAESATASQAVSPGTLEQRFGRLDSNGDGKITWEEAIPSREQDFARMDTNHDQRITPAEYEGAMPFGTFDRNTDGAIVQAEFMATHRRMFLKFDADADQRISLPEFAAAQLAAGK